MFRRILIANRGEIALRVCRTCREMGIATVGVYSDVDRDALHVRACDTAVGLGGSEPKETYLHIDKLVRVAREAGAEAIHPGYGFLSENGDFAQACEQAGLVFIGPPSAVLRSVGDKIRSRTLVAATGVPVIPGVHSSDRSTLCLEAERLGFPVMVKAAAGGGGKGMRRVERAADLSEAIERAASEAQSAFGDATLYLEKCIQDPRHVEVQILADMHGNVVHLFERECSIQRRHQKIIEESPSPGIGQALRERLGRAAVQVARTAGYRSAGTVEFLVAPDESFSFMEVNARLQVEHPVTELTTGLDLVEQQICIAAGLELAIRQDSVTRHGHAIECRIYAEDAENGFLPSPGRILYLQAPGGPGVRFDCGIAPDSLVPVEYDPILAKLITWGDDREKARVRMARALRETTILGVKTPLELLLDIVESRPFRQGETTTDFLPRHFGSWKPDAARERIALLGWLAAELAPRSTMDAFREVRGADPWKDLGRFRLGE